MTHRLLSAAALAFLAGGCTPHAAPPADTHAPSPQISTSQPPVAATKPHDVVSPHGTRNDPYYWLRDDTRRDPDVLAYLNAENDYTSAMLADVADLQDALFREIVGRIKQDDSTVPYRYHGYWYYTRYAQDSEYPIYARKKGSLDAPEQILLDGNVLGAGHDYFDLGDHDVSPNEKLLAYGQDTVGRRQYEILFRDLATDELLPDRLKNTTADLVWAKDSKSLFYIEKDPVTLLGTRVRKHTLGTNADSDPIVYEEADHSFYLSIGLTADEKYVLIYASSTVSDETWFLRADRPQDAPQVLLPRTRGFEYEADHLGKRWIIRTNLDAKNFRLATLDDGKVGDLGALKELVAHRDDVFIEGFDLFDDYLVIAQRSDALRRLQIRPWKKGKKGKTRFVEADEPVYSMWQGVNAETNSQWLRYEYGSLKTPDTVYELNMTTGERRLLKREEVLGGFDSSAYVTWREFATAADGTKIPISLLRRKDTPLDGTAPLYQYGYGSYGASMDPSFRSSMISLVDRGYVFAIAHVRGGQELGRAWYEDGKLLRKKNTFTDFVDVTKHLVAAGHVDENRVVAVGGSAGGLLVGAVVNLAPSQYQAVVAHVPFVDVVTTMLDESIPLTTNEFDEWGNPKDKPFYDYMLSYSPYDNVTAQDYPSMLVTTGLWDSQVQYFEPAKWIAKLRATKTDNNLLLLHTNMDAGHGGTSGRFRRQRETAREFAFILRQLATR